VHIDRSQDDVQGETVPAVSRARTTKQYVEPGDPLNVALVAVVAERQVTSDPKPPFHGARR